MATSDATCDATDFARCCRFAELFTANLVRGICVVRDEKKLAQLGNSHMSRERDLLARGFGADFCSSWVLARLRAGVRVHSSLSESAGGACARVGEPLADTLLLRGQEHEHGVAALAVARRASSSMHVRLRVLGRLVSARRENSPQHTLKMKDNSREAKDSQSLE